MKWTTPAPARPEGTAQAETERLGECASGLAEMLAQLECRRRWERDGRETARKLQSLYDRRLALLGQMYESMERCRGSVRTLQALQSKLDRLDGDLSEIDAVLNEGAAV